MNVNIEKIKEILDEERGVLSNENLWLLGSQTDEEIACHSSNIKQHLRYEILIESIIHILEKKEYDKLKNSELRNGIIEMIEFYSKGIPEYSEVLRPLIED